MIPDPRCPGEYISFADKNAEEITDLGKILSIGGLFAIVELPEEGKDIVGFFIEDDTIFHLKSVFHRWWLKDLANISSTALRNSDWKPLTEY